MVKSKAEKEEEESRGLTLGICSIIFGWMIPFLGLALGIIGLIRSTAVTPKILNTVGICESILFWIFVWILLI